MNSTAGKTDVNARKFQKVRRILEKYDRAPAKMVPILQAIQDEYRYLPESILAYVARALKISPARVFGVATFYSQFTLEPRGKYVVQICDGTACHVKGAMDIYEAMTEKLGLKDGQETTNDLLFTVETVSCVGACGLAPVITVNGQVHGNVNPGEALDMLDEIVDNHDIKEANSDE